MCGRYTLHTEKELLARRFALDLGPLVLEPRYNIAPTDAVLAVRIRRDERSAALMRWGLVPSWAKDPFQPRAGGRRASAPLINARAETIAEKPAYRRAFQRRRCLMLADGFYEWQPAPAPSPSSTRTGPGMTGKRPHWIARPDGSPFAFAGVYEVWWPEGAAPEDPPLLSCALVTTGASPDLAEIHGRMPVILPPEREALWIDPELDDQPDALLELLAAPPPGTLEARPVSRRVNTVANDGPELLTPEPDPRDPSDFRLEG